MQYVAQYAKLVLSTSVVLGTSQTGFVGAPCPLCTSLVYLSSSSSLLDGHQLLHPFQVRSTFVSPFPKGVIGSVALNSVTVV